MLPLAGFAHNPPFHFGDATSPPRHRPSGALSFKRNFMAEVSCGSVRLLIDCAGSTGAARIFQTLVGAAIVRREIKAPADPAPSWVIGIIWRGERRIDGLPEISVEHAERQ